MYRIGIALLSLTVLTGGAIAADIAADPVSTGRDWTGLYVGAQAGYLFGAADWRNTSLDGRFAEGSPESGAIGIFGGYDVDLGSIVLGVSGQYSFTDASSTAIFQAPAGDTATFDVSGYGSLDARLGFDLGRFLPYVAAGASVAQLDVYYDGVPDEDYATETLWGWSVGLGTDVALTDNLVARLEYRHSDFGDKEVVSNVTAPGATHDVSLTSDSLEVGLAWRF